MSDEITREWRCFHCDEVFVTVEAAQEHFGDHQLCEPACAIDAAKYREMERVVERHCAEDTDLHREIYGMQADHVQALIREEERGYARGVKDGMAYANLIRRRPWRWLWHWIATGKPHPGHVEYYRRAVS